MYEVPTSIVIDGRQFQIRNKGDYRVVLDCFQALEDMELEPVERVLSSLIIFYEDFTCPDDIDKIEKERREYITSNQVLYLIYKWGITKDDKIKFQHMDSKGKESFLLDTLIKHQTANFSKYIQSLRFILQIIRATEFQTERKDYYQHVSCRIGKEELEFLKFFSEFNIITEIYYGQK